MDKKTLMEKLKETGAYQEGHFILSSGLHSAHYVQCALLLQHPDLATIIGKDIADHFKDKGITCVVGPALGGIIIAYKVAEGLGVRSIFGERKDGDMSLRRGFYIEPGEKVLVVEDVITTGKSVKELIEVLKSAQADIVGVASIIDRSNGSLDFDCEFFSLLKLDITTYSSYDVPEWLRNIPAVKPGSRGI
ncbi:MAG: orotate phosphoribosyltransferase [Candidatus Auribacterota bacterium]|jgi:orotate phosphoribosyltransferase|nr:orotate phosphoribosyltransferase [Candidatus Auribacterota bacterium]